MLAAQLRATVQGCILVRQCTNFNGSNSPVHGYGTLANGRQFVEKYAADQTVKRAGDSNNVVKFRRAVLNNIEN